MVPDGVCRLACMPLILGARESFAVAPGPHHAAGINPTDAKDRQLIMEIAIKCGDISNGTKKLDLCKRWAGLIMEEFFQQVRGCVCMCLAVNA